MKLSIIVPVYNVEKYLPKCLDSLVNQTIDDYEIILVNDGSPDNSQLIIDDYKGKYPELIKCLVIDNGGQGRARNFGMDIARGEYIGFADSDDWVAADMFEKLYLAAVQANADISVCDVMAVFPDGREEYASSRYDEKNPLSCAGSCWDKIYRRELLTGIRFPEGLWYEDFSFSAKALLKSERICSTKEALYYYRCGHPSTMRNNNSARNLEIITIMEDIRAFAGEDGDRIQDLIINHILLDSINRVALHNSPNREEVIAKLRAYVKQHVPELSACKAFRAQSRNRRVVMMLNYMGLHHVSRLLLSVKRELRGK